MPKRHLSQIPPTDQLRYLAEALRDLKEMIPPEAGSLLPLLIDMAALEAMERAVGK